ncbi:hypothetical protein CSOJ01_07832 [Colletotrichum sojae]|uniref:Uncharacterized protein n=1 Tax=Colletotrichum sojae TaxID=2175907 RepID=A0A8H6J7U1_9PEZI|nr:hypothetical protein CSOJ01_07832 [Colletotrichum sojae]
MPMARLLDTNNKVSTNYYYSAVEMAKATQPPNFLAAEEAANNGLRCGDATWSSRAPSLHPRGTATTAGAGTTTLAASRMTRGGAIDQSALPFLIPWRRTSTN